MKKQDIQSRWLKILSLTKEYLIPFLALIVGISIAYANLNNRLVVYASAIEQLETKQEKMEDVENIMLQRLASIDAKLEYIISTLDKIK
jgi:Zn-dependent M16 (insulinase) family peptidase